ncbi:MAG: ComF family protein [Chitinophagaceae bacterium]|nr:MAG: ComF family protein [Chitinophagaceae bacterium]
MIKHAIDSLTHLFFPHICAGCGSDVISQHQLLCLACTTRLPLTGYYERADNPVEKTFWGRLPVQHAASYLYFNKDSIVQQLMHQFKYKGREEIGLYFGKKMGAALLSSGRIQPADYLVPLPLHPARQRKRGYNQAEVLCRGMSETLGIPVLPGAVTRNAETSSQTRKSRISRWDNMSGKFSVPDPEKLQNKHVILVDDVVTTGATLEACGQELMKAQGLLLGIATLAYTSV